MLVSQQPISSIIPHVYLCRLSFSLQSFRSSLKPSNDGCPSRFVWLTELKKAPTPVWRNRKPPENQGLGCFLFLSFQAIMFEHQKPTVQNRHVFSCFFFKHSTPTLRHFSHPCPDSITSHWPLLSSHRGAPLPSGLYSFPTGYQSPDLLCSNPHWKWTNGADEERRKKV